MNTTQLSKILHNFALLFIVVIFMMGCSSKKGKKGIQGVSTDSAITPTIPSADFKIDSVHPSSIGSSWSPKIDGQGRYHFKDLSVTVTGTCNKVTSLHVYKNGTKLPEETTCSVLGDYSWSKSFLNSDEGEFELVVKGYDSSNSLVVSRTILVKLDLTPPNTPVVSSPASADYFYNDVSSFYSIEGTVSSDTVKLIGPANQNIVITNGSWSYSAELTLGLKLDYGIEAEDFAGNRSAVVTQSITWGTPNFIFQGTGVSLGQVEVSSDSLNQSLDLSVGFVGGIADSNHIFETGFQNIVASLRGQL